MKKKLLEETVLFISIIKWAILSTLVGLIVGFATSFFLKLIDTSSNFMQSYDHYFLLLPVIIFLSSLVNKYLAPDTKVHSTDTANVIEAIHKKWGKIRLATIPVNAIATIITLAGGGSAGKEGPSAQLGGGLASLIADILRLNKEDRKKIVICGISAGIAAVFGTPISGALFAVEVIVLGKMLNDVLFPCLASSIISFNIAKKLGVTYFYQKISILSSFSIPFFIKILLCGIFFGIVSLLLIESMKLFQRAFKKIKIWTPLIGLLGGFILVILTFIFSPIYLGLGTKTITAAINGDNIPTMAFLWKILFTSITLSTGGSGGIITPLFFIGATSGSTFAHIFGLDSNVFAAIGTVALLAGAANTPITASVMAIEIYGPEIGPYAAIACAISYIASGHRSVYPNQILGCTKSASICIPLMGDMKNINDVEIYNKPGKVLYNIKYLGLKVIEKIKLVKEHIKNKK